MSWDSNHPNHGGISIGLKLGGNDNDDELKKQKADLELMKELLDRGYSQDAAQYIIKKQKETGQLDTTLPSFTNALHPSTQPNRPVPLPPVTDIPERSTLRDFGPMKKKGFMALDENNPPQTPQDIIDSMIPVPDEYSTVTPVVYNKKSDGFDVYVDAATGKEIRREPNGTKANKTIKVGSTSNNTAVNDPMTKTMVDYFKDYNKAAQEGTANPDDPIAKSYARYLGLKWSEVPSVENPTPSPNFLQKVFGIKPETPSPTPGKGFPQAPEKNGGATKTPGKGFPQAPQFQSAEEVRAAFKAGKLDRGQALEILRTQFGHK